MIKRESIEGLKNNLDIIDTISKYLELKKNGANFKALCPFHDENTPSLIISPAKQIYHCFGCHAGGDTIKFVMEYEKLNYVQVIEKLAEENNYSLEYEENTYSQNKQKYQDSFNILREFMIFTQLKLSNNIKVQEYLKSRVLYESSIEKFELGYAPSSKETLLFLQEKNISTEDAFNAGVLKKGDNGFYASFMERITFPIYNNSSKVIGFGGRTINNHPAKYVNSSSNSIFNKSKTLYALNLAKEHIYKKNEVIITEGYMDTIMLHQAGFYNVIATLGTALTNEHTFIIKKFTSNVIMAYDGDNAGMEASYKSALLLLSKDINAKVGLFQKGDDPADLVANNQIDKLSATLKHARPSIEYIIDYKLKKYDLNIAEEKQKAYDDIIDFCSSLGNITRSEYKNYIANALSIDERLIEFKDKKEEAKENNNTTDARRDIQGENKQELELIKTILEYPSLLEGTINILDSIHFDTCKQEFEALKNNDFNNEKLIAINFREDIKSYNEDDLKLQIIFFLKKFYIRLLKSKLKTGLSFEEIVYIKRILKENIDNLTKKKLLAFDDSILKYFD